MEARARAYSCPECGYSKSPTTHTGGCGGVVVYNSSGDKWECNACGKRMDDTYITCASCGEKLNKTGRHVKTIVVRI